MKKFSDFATDSTVFVGDKIKIDVLKRDVVVKGYKITNSKYKDGKMLTIQISLNDEDRVIFTGSQVLIDQCEKYKDEIPFMAKIEQVDKYYTFA